MNLNLLSEHKNKKIFYMSFWLERLSILLQIYTFACNFCSRKGGRASIGYRASIGTYTVYILRRHYAILIETFQLEPSMLKVDQK